ncbi:MAG TPA: NUDIX hydrolase [Anaerolineales bacterium]|nr:NUDIX hydrolase [Anaerolineales bacterium]
MRRPSQDRSTVLASRLVYTGRVFRVRSDRVRLPSGAEPTLDVVEHGGAVVIVPRLDPDRLVMIRQYRYAAGTDLLEFPAGTLEPGEDPGACAQRELREETGYAAQTLKALGGFYLAPGYSTEYLHIYLADGLSESPLPGDEDEILHAEIKTLSEIEQAARSGEIEDAKSLAAFYLTTLVLGT